MSIMNLVEGMSALLVETAIDAEKADKGNKAAGTRVRKAMQEMKNKATEVRKEVLAAKN